MSGYDNGPFLEDQRYLQIKALHQCSYKYKRSSSSVDYDISLRRTSNFNVCLLQTEGTSLPLEYQQVIPDAVHVLNSSFSGIKDKYVLTLSVFDWSTPCYWIHVRGTGSSSDMTCWRNLNMANLYIDPDTGKVIDIEWYNYFYENLNYKLTFTTMPLSQLFEVLFDSSVVVKYPIF